jgi:hypothetical protein
MYDQDVPGLERIYRDSLLGGWPHPSQATGRSRRFGRDLGNWRQLRKAADLCDSFAVGGGLNQDVPGLERIYRDSLLGASPSRRKRRVRADAEEESRYILVQTRKGAANHPGNASWYILSNPGTSWFRQKKVRPSTKQRIPVNPL